MADIKAADVSKLRKMTGAGMMDCKKALQETNGDFDKATEIIRKKGQAVASKRADREASEGVVLARTSADGKHGFMMALNCETDFVAKNENFIKFARRILDLATEKQPKDLEALKALNLEGKSVSDAVTEQVGVIGEKLDLPFYGKIDADSVTAYIHPGNMLASLVGLNKEVSDQQVGKDVAMQIAAMNPVAVDKDNVAQEVIDKEFEIGKEQARKEGKPEEILEKIATGKLNKFFREYTLLNQDFVKEHKKSVRQYLLEVDNDLTVTGFVRFGLKD
ncbi:MAG: elongation factor Ts [Bacteroidales bacterium]|nr:elongation factor Ts [Bacteroidales bacterium]